MHTQAHTHARKKKKNKTGQNQIIFFFFFENNNNNCKTVRYNFAVTAADDEDNGDGTATGAATPGRVEAAGNADPPVPVAGHLHAPKHLLQPSNFCCCLLKEIAFCRRRKK